MLNKQEVKSMFPDVMGNGKEIREDVANLFKDNSILDKWKDKFPSYLHDMVYNNFIAPMLADDITVEEQKKLAHRLDLFCASIY